MAKQQNPKTREGARGDDRDDRDAGDIETEIDEALEDVDEDEVDERLDHAIEQADKSDPDEVLIELEEHDEERAGGEDDAGHERAGEVGGRRK